MNKAAHALAEVLHPRLAIKQMQERHEQELEQMRRLLGAVIEAAGGDVTVRKDRIASDFVVETFDANGSRDIYIRVSAESEPGNRRGV